MTSQPMQIQQWKQFALVLAYTLAIAFLAAVGIRAQQLRKGVSVHMVSTTSAQPMPAADDEDAWVIAITDEGRLFFGVDPVSSTELLEKMKSTPRRRDQNLYIKADARAPFIQVRNVLEAAKEDLFESPVLLTSQHAHLQPGTMVPPTGLEVLLAQSSAGSEPPVVQVRSTGKESPSIEVNHHPVPQADLQRMLVELLRNQSEKNVALEADGKLPFAQIAQVIDACHAAGARVILATPEI